MGPLQLQLMDQEERLARVGVLCTGPTRLFAAGQREDATETKRGFRTPAPYHTGLLRPLGSRHEAWTAAARAMLNY